VRSKLSRSCEGHGPRRFDEAVGGPECCPEYVSVWCALDDIDRTNGCLVILPGDAPQPPHAWHEPASPACSEWLDGRSKRHSLAGCVAAGTAIVFSSRLWHCSEPNRAERDRRAFYAQYSLGAIGGESDPFVLAVRTAPSAPDNFAKAYAPIPPYSEPPHHSGGPTISVTPTRHEAHTSDEAQAE